MVLQREEKKIFFSPTPPPLLLVVLSLVLLGRTLTHPRPPHICHRQHQKIPESLERQTKYEPSLSCGQCGDVCGVAGRRFIQHVHPARGVFFRSFARPLHRQWARNGTKQSAVAPTEICNAAHPHEGSQRIRWYWSPGRRRHTCRVHLSNFAG